MKTTNLKVKAIFVAFLLLGSTLFASELPGGTCETDTNGKCECFTELDGSGNITGYRCDKAQSNPVIFKCACPPKEE